MEKQGLLSTLLNNKFAIIMFVVCIVLSIAVFIIYKQVKSVQSTVRNHQKQTNEITNLKYGLQDTINVVNDMRKNFIVKDVNYKDVNKDVNKDVTYKKQPKKEKIEIETVISEDVDGESESEVVEFDYEDDEEDE